MTVGTQISKIVKTKMARELKTKKTNRFKPSISLVPQKLLSDISFKTTVDSTLKILGKSSDVDRVCLYECCPDIITSEINAVQKYCWVKKGSRLKHHNFDAKIFPINGKTIFSDYLIKNKAFCRLAKNIEKDFIPIDIKSLCIVSLLIIPIFINNRLWGFIEFDDCTKERIWAKNEINILAATAHSLGVSINNELLNDTIKRENEKYKFALESCDVCLWDLDLISNRMSYSPGCMKILGYNESDLNNLQTEWNNIVHPDDILFVKDHLEKYLNGIINEYKCEYRLQCQDGSYKYILDQGKISEFTKDNKPVRMIGNYSKIALDNNFITAEIIRKNLNTLLKIFPDNIYIINREGMFLDQIINDSNNAPYKQKNIVGRKISDLFSAEFANNALFKIEECLLKKRVVEYHYDLFFKNSLHYYAARMYPISDDEIIAIVNDFSELVNDHVETRKIKDLISIFDNSSSAFILIGKDGKIKTMNKTTIQFMHWYLGYSFNFDCPIDERISEEHKRIFEQSIYKDLLEKYNKYEKQITAIDGTYRWFEIKNFPIFNNEHEEQCIFLQIDDITHKKNVENALIENEKRLLVTQRLINLGYWEINLLTNRLIWSENTYKMLGFEPDSIEPTFEIFLDLIIEEDRTTLLSAFDNLIYKYEPYKIILRFSIHNEIKFIETQAELFFSENGEPTKVLGTAIDITEKYLMEETLKLSEKKYRTYFEESPIAIFIIDTEAKFLEVNRAACKLFDYRREELLQMKLMDIFHPESLLASIECLGNLNKEGKMTREFKIISKNKNVLDIIVNTVKPTPNRCVGFAQDITQINQMVKELAEHKRTTENFFNAMTDMVFFYDIRKNKMIYLNAAAEKVMERTLSDLLNDINIWIDAIHTDDIQSAKTAFQEVIEGVKERISIEYRIINSTGNARWVWTRAWLIKDDQNNPVRLEGIISDINESKTIETATRQALEKEKELNELKSRFISTMSHEFRTPLTSIYSSAELLEHYANQWDENKRNYYLLKIQESVIFLNGLLDDILLINKSESGILEFNPAEVSINSLCDEILEDIPFNINPKVIIKRSIKTNKSSYLFDERLIKQIIKNLLSNAIKYSPNGGEIIFDVSDNSQELIILVKDRGIGIPINEKEKLFKKFFRGSNASYVQGTGLGLTIVKNAVDLHGGTIEFDSEEGQGSTFTIKLPIIPKNT